MQTNLAKKIQQTGHAETIESILRKCVHCGFCNATCPTYQLLGDELDGPRGRIYQMKQYFEGAPANPEMLKHLDRCLTCRACETTCPSGVDYSHLLEIGRESIERELPRAWWDRARRRAIVRFINSGWLFKMSVRSGQLLAPLLPGKLRQSIPPRQTPIPRTVAGHQRKMLMLAGCVQPTLAPNTNNHAVNLLDKLGVEVIEAGAGLCCGAAAMHTSDSEYGMTQIRRLIDSWWPHVEAGAEAIVVTATGCGTSVKDYGRILEQDPEYAQKAATVSSLYRDLLEVIEDEADRIESPAQQYRRVAVHTPCSMQHGLGINGRVERLLARAGYEICRVEDGHLCCGSAGTYSMLQPALAARLHDNKIAALCVEQPDVIVTANIGCQLHLAQGNPVPVRHWIELL
ncbi:MAG: glycolate oxidase subunit GlcF [Gammaproteobacteria bacterium]|nr:glycolate oxidase subunit GlcF [Gammaproteobacteria bacterium]MDH3535797.1 glycolate oxidase subunit GlcF [Gammaproteobacteria bacterium]